MAVSQNTVDPIQTTDSCLVGCEPPCANVAPRGQTLDYHMVAPWIEVIILPPNDGFVGPRKPFYLTVGNNSFPDDDPGLRHSAVIKDFEYGTSDGAGCRFTVHDQLGSPFVTFIERMNKRFNNVTNDYTMQIRFGWIGKDCNQNHVEIKSRTVTFLPTSVENTFNDGGKVVYTIEGTDTLWHVGQGRNAKTYGTDGARMGLQEAIIKMFEETPEPRIKVKFLRQKQDGTTETWKFKDNPQSVWQSSSKSKLEAALDWMKPHLTDADKGIYYTWDTSESIPTIIFWEAPYNGKDVISPICIKHYVVNGGKCSPVISFTPRAKWAFSKILNKTGGGAGVGGVKAFKGQGQEGFQQEVGAGLQMHTVSQIRNSVLDTYGLSSETTERVMKAEIENSRRFFPFSESVSAELVIQGDPSNNYVDIQAWTGKTLSITVINPFHLLVDGSPSGTDENPSASCPIWLAAPACNPVFTSNMWFIQKVNHSIKAGSYLTTLSLLLPVAGADVTAEQLDPFEINNPAQQE